MMSDLPTDQPIVKVMAMAGKKNVSYFEKHRHIQSSTM